MSLIQSMGNPKSPGSPIIECCVFAGKSQEIWLNPEGGPDPDG
jgi:hypothetical protein